MDWKKRVSSWQTNILTSYPLALERTHEQLHYFVNCSEVPARAPPAIKDMEVMIPGESPRQAKAFFDYLVSALHLA
jgi:hypothetical protein